jgi:hypothetical protein
VKDVIFPLYIIAITTAAAITAMAIRADMRLKSIDRLPIHWNAKLEPDNYGSRRLALFCMPALFAPILLGTALALHLIPPGPINKTSSPEEGLVVMLFMAVTFWVVKYVYLRAIFRWVEKNQA